MGSELMGWDIVSFAFLSKLRCMIAWVDALSFQRELIVVIGDSGGVGKS